VIRVIAAILLGFALSLAFHYFVPAKPPPLVYEQF
jgi:hypothetical protein